MYSVLDVTTVLFVPQALFYSDVLDTGMSQHVLE